MAPKTATTGKKAPPQKKAGGADKKEGAKKRVKKPVESYKVGGC